MTRFETAMMDMAVAYRLGSPESRAIVTAMDHARAALAMEAAKPTRREAGSARKGDSAGPKDNAQ